MNRRDLIKCAVATALAAPLSVRSMIGLLGSAVPQGFPNPVGGNLAASGAAALVYEDFPLTQNIVPMSGAFYQASAGSIGSTLQALNNGWPMGDFGHYLHWTAQSPSWMSGAFACGFVSNGSGGETITGVNATVGSVTRSGTLVTFTLTPTAGNWGVTITGTTGGVASYWAYMPGYASTATSLIASQGNAHLDITIANVQAGKPLFTTDALKFYKQMPLRWMWGQNMWYCCGSSSIALASNVSAGATSATLVANSLAPGTYTVFFRPTSLPNGAPSSSTVCADIRSITITSTGQTAISWTGGLNFGASAIHFQNSGSNRNTPANTKNQKSWAGAGYDVEGYPAEWAIAFAVACGQGLYLNFPIFDDGTWYQSVLTYIYNNVPAGFPVYIEFGNEIWNQVGSCNIPFYGLAYQQFPSATSAVQAAGQYLAYVWHNISTYGKSLFGSRWNKDIRPVIAWQEGTSNVQQTMLAYYISQGWTPSTDIWATSVAIYLNASPAIATTDTVAQIETKLATGVPLQCATNHMEHLLAVSLWYGLPGGVVNYEWGWDSKGLWSQNNSYANLGAACLDSGMATIYQDLAQSTLDYGASAFFVFESGVNSVTNAGAPYDEWHDNYADLISTGAPRLTGVQSVSSGTYVPQRNVLAKSGDTIDARNYLDGSTSNSYPTWTPQFNVSPINNYNVGWHIYVPKAATLTIAGYFTTTASSAPNVYLDGIEVASAVNIPNGLSGTTPVTLFTKAFTAGHHYIEIGTGAYIGGLTGNSLAVQ